MRNLISWIVGIEGLTGLIKALRIDSDLFMLTYFIIVLFMFPPVWGLFSYVTGLKWTFFFRFGIYVVVKIIQIKLIMYFNTPFSYFNWF
jgi:hypothetical protein